MANETPHDKFRRMRGSAPRRGMGGTLPLAVAKQVQRTAQRISAGEMSLDDIVPYDTPEIRIQEQPAAREAEFRARGGGTAGLRQGPPGAGRADTPVVHQPGGSVQTASLQHPAYNTQERLYRTLADQAFYRDISPTRPFKFDLGAFTSPMAQQFWLTDYEFRVNRFSGADPGDFVPAEVGRFSGKLGFDINVDGERTNNVSYELDPKPITNSGPQYRPSPFTTSAAFGVFSTADFDEAASQTFGNTSGQGSSLLPVRPNVMGPRSGPFTMVIPSGKTVVLSCTIFRTLTTPIHSIEGRMAGFLIGQNTAIAIINRLFPQ